MITPRIQFFFSLETTVMVRAETSLYFQWHITVAFKLYVFLFLVKLSYHCLHLFPDCHWSDEQPALLTHFHSAKHPLIINIYCLPTNLELTPSSLLTQLLKMSLGQIP